MLSIVLCMYPVVTTYAGKRMLKDPEKSSNCWHIAQRLIEKIPRNYQLFTEIILTLMMWKRPNLSRCIASVSIRKESLCRPSVPDLWLKYSPEGTRVIPRERYVSYFVLKTPKSWKDSEEFIHTGSKISKPDPKISLTAHTLGLFFMPYMNCSHCIENLRRLLM